MTASSDKATLAKVYYLLALAVILFLIDQPLILAGLFLLQLSLWFRHRLPLSGLARAGRKMWLFFLIIFITYLVTGSGQDSDRWITVPVSWLPEMSK